MKSPIPMQAYKRKYSENIQFLAQSTGSLILEMWINEREYAFRSIGKY